MLPPVQALPPALVWECVHPPAVEIPQDRPRLELRDPDRPEGPPVIVEFDRMTWDAAEGVHRLSGNVVATYETLRLTSAEAEIDDTNKIARFRTGVKAVEPDLGTLSAEEITIRYATTTEGGQEGVARGIVMDVFEGHFEAEELRMRQGRFEMRGAKVTMCDRENPDFLIGIDRISVVPERNAFARNAYIQLGRRVRIPVPFFNVGLNPEQTGFQLPQPDMGENFELGYRWRNVLQLSSKSAFLYEQSGKLDEEPYVNAQVAVTTKLRKGSETRRMIAIRNEDRERFQNGYWDNIIVLSPEQESDSISAGEINFFAGRTTNFRTSARPGDRERMEREWYVGAQGAGDFGRLLVQGNVRYGAIRSRDTFVEDERFEGYSTILLPEWPLSDGLSLRVRADAAAFAGDSSAYGWVRPMVGLIGRPRPGFTFSLGYFQAAEFGDALFNSDRLYSEHGLHFRADIDLPATDISLLLKYDFDRAALYDVEVSVGQIAHCIRPFVTYRKFPGSFQFGFTLRADKLFDALKRKSVKQIGGDKE